MKHTVFESRAYVATKIRRCDRTNGIGQNGTDKMSRTKWWQFLYISIQLNGIYI